MTPIEVLRFIWSVVVGSLRLILFFGNLILLLLSVFWISVLIAMSDQSQFASLSDIFYGFLVLSLSVLGCYGSFFNHQKSIKIFSYANLALLVFLLIVGIVRSPSQKLAIADEVMKTMPMYSWTGAGNAETKLWDQTQEAKCCGYYSYTDWDRYRPAGIPSDEYPRSCCDKYRLEIFNTRCKKEDVYKMGCSKFFEFMIMVALGIGIALFSLQIIMCVVGFMIGGCGVDSCTNLNASGLRGSNSGINNDYRHFETNAYPSRSVPSESFVSHEKRGAPLEFDKADSTAPPRYPNV